MTRRSAAKFRIHAAGVGLAVLACGHTMAQVAPRVNAAVQSLPGPEVRYAERLARLRPAEPEAYFRLAEEIADESGSGADRKLAQRLYVLAYTLDVRLNPRPTIAASACLGLAALTSSEGERQWLKALARLLDPAQGEPEWTRPAGVPPSESGAFQLAQLLGLARTGQGGRVRSLLESQGVRSALEAFEKPMLRIARLSPSDLEREALRWPCTECGNDRFVRRRGSGVGPNAEPRLCPICKGTPGTPLSAEQLAAQLRFESWLLQGRQRSWAAQFAVDGGAPLLDPSPGELTRVYFVDPALVVFRDGQWVADESAPAPASNPLAPGIPPELIPGV